MTVEGVPADPTSRLILGGVSPPVHDLAPPFADLVTFAPSRVDGGDRYTDIGYNLGVLERHPIVASKEDPILTETLVESARPPSA